MDNHRICGYVDKSWISPSYLYIIGFTDMLISLGYPTLIPRLQQPASSEGGRPEISIVDSILGITSLIMLLGANVTDLHI